QKQIFNTFNSALAKNETFTDNREGSTVTVCTLDVSKVTTDVNAGKLTNFNGVVYFSDQRASQTGGTPKNGLRIKNCSALPTNTTVNAAIVAGDVPTANGNYSGGAENLVRFLEDWVGKTFTYYGSLVEIYHSRQAIGTWGKANVYNPPSEYFYYDANFQLTSP